MEIKEMYRVSFKSKHDDRGDYQICVSARNSDKALDKAMKQIEKNKEELKGLTDVYYMLNEDIRALSQRTEEQARGETMEFFKRLQWRAYYYDHLPTVENIGFCIK